MGVLYLTEPDNSFEDLYLDVREKEHRIFSDAEVAVLPDIPENHPLVNEWKLRKKSASRFINYIRKQKRPIKILEIGCGNGWFSHLMAKVENTDITGLDVNSRELEQADSVFRRPNLKFVYADIFAESDLQKKSFDLIVFNSCFQYFNNAEKILKRCCDLLADDGEIHIIDSPFYKSEEIAEAKIRTKKYYSGLGFPQMAENYFHHNRNELPQYKIRYKPSFFSKLLKTDSPFCWISIVK